MGAKSVAAPRLVNSCCAPVSWGSRPRLIIFRRSAARTERRREFSARLGVFAGERRSYFPLTRVMSAKGRQRRFLVKRMTFAVERRRRDRCLAWGVSPRYEEIKQRMSPRRGRQMNGG
jgi:hypothetical protein